jgi:NADH-quinone oxidoreductase subunit L
VPLILLAPLAAFIVAVSSVRTRRGSTNTALLGALLSLAATLLVAWGIWNRTTPYNVSYVYLQMNLAFSGPTNFQNFEMDIALHVDRLAVVALAVVEVCVVLVALWNRIMGRNEPGTVRFQSLISVFLFGAIGTILSSDLAVLIVFWAIAGAITYLMLAHRWGDDAAARNGRIALALPFVTDLFLICGVAVLYSRYGKNNLADLIPILHTTAGWTVRQLVVASVLLFVGVAGRMALWPLHSWITSTLTTAPPAASAIAQAAWPVIAITVLYRVLPIFHASSAQAMKDIVIACAVSAIAAPLLSLFAMEPRRAIALAGSAIAAIAAAITIHGFQYPGFTFAIAGVAVVLAAAPARAAAVLAAASIANAIRSDDMRDMGETWRRMRASTVVLLGVAVVIGLCAVGALALAVDSRSRFGFALGDALFLAVVAGFRVFMSVGFGTLPRRRAFDPDRVRDAPTEALGWQYWLVVAALALVVASFTTYWLAVLDGGKHHYAGAAAYAVWAVVALLGAAGAVLGYVLNREGALSASGWLSGVVDAAILRGSEVLDRFILRPVAGIADATGALFLAGDSTLGRTSIASGIAASAATRAPALPVVIVMAVLLALLIGLLVPGVIR